MTNDLKKAVALKVLQFLKGQKLEKNKFEIKSKWYDLSWRLKQEQGKTISNREYYEFVKDCTSIINSYGADEGFIVIGVGEDRTLVDTDIKDSGKTNPSEIKDIIIANVDKAFIIDIDYIDVEGKKLSVIHIPISMNKPHLIKEYFSPANISFPNEIFFRNGSGAVNAGKGDLDRMYWERKNIELERKYEIGFHTDFIDFNKLRDDKIVIQFKPSFENLGTRKLLISEFEMTINLANERHRFYDNSHKGTPIVLLPNDARQIEIIMESEASFSNQSAYIRGFRDDRKNLKFESFLITLATDNQQLLAIPNVRSN